MGIINLYEDNKELAEASLDKLLDRITQEFKEESKSRLAEDTDDDYVKVEAYERKTTEER